MFYLVRYQEVEDERKKDVSDLFQKLNNSAPDVIIKKDRGRIWVETASDISEILSDTYGIVSYSPCIECSLTDLDNTVLEYASKIIVNKKTFAIKIKRAGLHMLTSKDFAKKLGEKIMEKSPGLKVDLENPDVTINIEIRGISCYIFHEVLPGIKGFEKSKAGLKFVADSMLGTLARRLRMLGYDTAYPGDVADREVIKISNDEGRIVLTRDTNLVKVRGVNAILLKDTKMGTQLKEVMKKLNIKLDKERIFTICSECNVPLEIIDKESIKDKVPKLVYDSFSKFKTCPNCKRIYWPGTHYERILLEFKNL
ncbi:MAG: THUMP domain-containing protein [Candidatus Saganbacteria bacterium]|nr:THUMP domain-containing protein [Candidatus Saganbacteria bacterium]